MGQPRVEVPKEQGRHGRCKHLRVTLGTTAKGRAGRLLSDWRMHRNVFGGKLCLFSCQRYSTTELMPPQVVPREVNMPGFGAPPTEI